jgi:hypothetical protein
MPVRVLSDRPGPNMSEGWIMEQACKALLSAYSTPFTWEIYLVHIDAL